MSCECVPSPLARASLSPHARAFVAAHAAAHPDAGGIPFGGMVSFRVRGGAAQAEAFLTATRLFALAESLGGVESLAEHPARMTHGSIPEAERALLGIGDNLVRLSVGVEEVEEGVLLEVLIAALRRTIAEVAGSKKVCFFIIICVA